MSIDTSLIHTAFMLVPGFLAVVIYDKLKQPVKSDFSWKVVMVFIVSIFLHLFIAVIPWVYYPGAVLGYTFQNFRGIIDSECEIDYVKYFAALLAAPTFAFLFYRSEAPLGDWLIRHRLWASYGRDIWWHFHNNSETSWAWVVDHRYRMSYLGSIYAYSEAKERRELVLDNVSVYTYVVSDDMSWSVTHLYDTERLYLSRDFNEITIEQGRPEPPCATTRPRRPKFIQSPRP